MSAGESARVPARVVEAVADVVGRQELRAVDLERQEVANGVRVLRAVQAMRRNASRVRPRRGRTVELRFEPGTEPVVLRRSGTRAAGGRHHPAAQLQDDPLPDVRRHPDAGDVERVEGQPARAAVLVVTGDAVAIEERALRRRRRGR